ncbi:MAG: AAA family ATPase [Planctomycetota bacterium]
MQRLLQRRPAASPVVRDRVEGRVLAVASGKGGTGKSFLVTNLAVALHRAGKRTAVVDCDFGLGNAHLLFGVNPPLAMHHLLGGMARPHDVMVRTPHGPTLVAGGSGISSLAELEERHFDLLAQSLGTIAREHDVVLLDCAAGLSPQSLLTILAAEHLILVTNPEIAALTDAYALVKCVARQPRAPEVHLVVNRVPEPGQGRPTFDRLAEVTRRFVGRSLHYIGEVAENPAVSHRRLGQPPLVVSHPECGEAAAIRAIMNGLELAVGPLVAGLPALGEGVERRLRRCLRRR